MEKRFSVGPKLRSLRHERALSQRDLAGKAGLSPNAISLIERDEISPSVATLQRLAGALGVKMGYFFSEEEATRILFVHAGQGPAISTHGVTIGSLGSRLKGQQMDPFLVALAPH